MTDEVSSTDPAAGWISAAEREYTRAKNLEQKSSRSADQTKGFLPKTLEVQHEIEMSLKDTSKFQRSNLRQARLQITGQSIRFTLLEKQKKLWLGLSQLAVLIAGLLWLLARIAFGFWVVFLVIRWIFESIFGS